MPKPYLSVIIPASDEAKRLPLTLLDIDRHLSEAEYSSEIVVVNDGSRDEIIEAAKRFGALVRPVKIIGWEEYRGKGLAVREGMLAAHGNIRLFTGADNAVSINHFDLMIPYFKEGYDVVIGSRGVQGAACGVVQSWRRKVVGKIGRWILRTMASSSVLDAQCEFQAFTEEAAERVFHLSKLNRWAFDIEALAIATHLGYRIKEIPVRWIDDVRSSVRLLDFLKTLWETMKIRRRFKQGIYMVA